MIILDTGEVTKMGEPVHLGDILGGRNTHKMVVLLDRRTDALVVEALEPSLKIMNFALGEFLTTWSDLKVVGSILKSADYMAKAFGG